VPVRFLGWLAPAARLPIAPYNPLSPLRSSHLLNRVDIPHHTILAEVSSSLYPDSIIRESSDISKGT
jgi:hypothetical protein